MRVLLPVAGLVLAAGCGADPVPIPAGDSGPAPAPLPPLELCINEFVADNATGWQDGSGLYQDWIELHNPTSAAVLLDGWTVTDDPAKPDKHALDGLVIEAGGFVLLAADNAPDLGPEHLSFALSGAGESVGLFRADGAGEVLIYAQTVEDFAWARTSDCCADAVACTAPRWHGTPGASNAL